MVSTETDPTKLAAEEKRNAVRYNKQYDCWETNEAEFNYLWVKAYGLIWDTGTSTELRRIIKEISGFSTSILDSPLELLRTIKQQMHVPSRAVYPILTLIESLSMVLSVKQGDKEGLISYMERFKSKKCFNKPVWSQSPGWVLRES